LTLKKKPSAAAKVRAALDPKPPQIADDPALQRQRELSVVEAARPPPADVRLLSAAMVMSKVGISWPTLWAWSKCGKFPAPRQISTRKIMWIESEVDAWIANLPVRKLPLKGDSNTDEEV